MNSRQSLASRGIDRRFANACKEHRHLPIFAKRTALRKEVYEEIAARWNRLGGAYWIAGQHRTASSKRRGNFERMPRLVLQGTPILGPPTSHGHVADPGSGLAQLRRDIAKGRPGAMPSDLWDELPECSGSIRHLRD